MYRLIIPGRPITKKNSQQIFINQKTGKRFISQSEAYKAYETASLWILKSQRTEFITTDIRLICLYYMPDKKSWPDLIGLLQATQDILQNAGIIANDRQVRHYGDSHIVGVDKHNPRVEIEIEEWAG